MSQAFGTADDLGAAIRVHSSGSGCHTYVLIHGIGVSSRYFRPLATELARTATVHNVDLPGHGSAPKPKHLPTVPGFARAVWSALEKLGVQSPVLVGHSMGAQVAVEMAHQLPTAASKLVLLGPTNYPPERTGVLQGFRLGQDTLREPWRVNAVVFSDYILRCGPRWYFRTLPAMLGNRIEERITEVQIPVLVVRGKNDPIVPSAWAGSLAQLAPRGTLVEVEGESHVLMYRSARAVADLCRAAAETP